MNVDKKQRRPTPETGYRIPIDANDVPIDAPVRVWSEGFWYSAQVRDRDSNTVTVRFDGVVGRVEVVPRYMVAIKMQLSVTPQAMPSTPQLGVLDVHVQTLHRRIDALLHEIDRGTDALDRTRAGLVALRKEVSGLPRRNEIS